MEQGPPNTAAKFSGPPRGGTGAEPCRLRLRHLFATAGRLGWPVQGCHRETSPFPSPSSHCLPLRGRVRRAGERDPGRGAGMERGQGCGSALDPVSPPNTHSLQSSPCAPGCLAVRERRARATLWVLTAPVFLFRSAPYSRIALWSSSSGVWGMWWPPRVPAAGGPGSRRKDFWKPVLAGMCVCACVHECVCVSVCVCNRVHSCDRQCRG